MESLVKARTHQFRQIVSWQIGRVVYAMNWRRTVAVSLISLWVALVCTINMPLQIETEQVENRLKRSNTLESKKFQTAPPATSNNLTREFISSLPSFETSTNQLRSLNKLAEKNGVVIVNSHYRYEKVQGLPITKVAIVMDVRGDEKQQRRFLQSTLNSFPNLSISRLAYVANTDSASTWKQKLDVNLYFRAPEKAAA